MKFSNFWKTLNTPQEQLTEYVRKSSDKLTVKEIKELQGIIDEMQAKGKASSQIISYIQKWNEKLADRYKAVRAFETEAKRLDTNNTINAAVSQDTDTFKVMLSPNACPVCREKTQEGNKVFTVKDLQKAGFGHKPPFHPHCYCLLLPIA